MIGSRRISGSNNDYKGIMESNSDSKFMKNAMEKEILKQFRSHLSDVLRPDDTDAILLKWLRAKNFNLRKCETLFRENIRCRAVHKVDEFEKVWINPEVVQKYEFANHVGFAKDGTPIHYMAFGRGDLHGFVMSVDIFDLVKYCCNVLERDSKFCREQSRKLGKDIIEVTYIVDMEGFAIGNAICSGVVETGLDLFRILQDHYPEIWKHVFIVNAPTYFYTAFNLIRPILRHTFVKNVRVVSREQTAELLLKYVDADVLPAFLGGKRVDSHGNPMCSEFVNFGGKIPEKYYLRNRCPLLPTDAGVETTWIPPRGCYNIPILIKKTDSVIRLEARSEGGSIFAALLFRSFEEDPENPDFPAKDEYLNEHDEKCNVQLVSPYMHWQMHLAPLNNFFFAPWPGIYIFKFDNTYNWLTGRKLIWRLSVTLPSV